MPKKKSPRKTMKEQIDEGIAASLLGRFSEGLTAVTVSGFKSIRTEQTVEIRPLTILAGTNSAGKSSIMQPLLLMKQTLEAPYDTRGKLYLEGQHISFTSADQFLSRGVRPTPPFSVRFQADHSVSVTSRFSREAEKSGLRVTETHYQAKDREMPLRLGMSPEEIRCVAPADLLDDHRVVSSGTEDQVEWSIYPYYCFLMVGVSSYSLSPKLEKVVDGVPLERPALSTKSTMVSVESPFMQVEYLLREIMHVTPLRRNPDRAYPAASQGRTYRGRFENYTAGIVAEWQETKDPRLGSVAADLSALGLGTDIQARRLDDTKIELRIPRNPAKRSASRRDFVSVADVGSGVSQVLPVLVALRAAEPRQLVYIEQPENDLHPRAQHALAEVLAAAAIRGVRVVAETHSSILLLGIQSLVAEGKLDPALVKLHWFKQNKTGATEINSADLDESGAFGAWDEDFSDVELKAQARYLDAAELRGIGG
jgi:hypothetical protein